MSIPRFLASCRQKFVHLAGCNEVCAPCLTFQARQGVVPDALAAMEPDHADGEHVA